MIEKHVGLQDTVLQPSSEIEFLLRDEGNDETCVHENTECIEPYRNKDLVFLSATNMMSRLCGLQLFQHGM